MIELKNYTGQPCKSRTAYEFVPREEQNLNLERAARRLAENGVYIELEAPYLLMLKVSGRNVSLFKSGKIIVKSTQDRGRARETAEKLIEKMGP